MRYVVGFAFDMEATNVLLILKAKPDWQKGHFNGVGGKVEIAERPIDAMVREFREETQLITAPGDWTHFVQLQGSYNEKETDQYVSVHFYFTHLPNLAEARSLNPDESLMIGLVKSLSAYPTIPNLQWMIPLAKNWNNRLQPNTKYGQPILVREISN